MIFAAVRMSAFE